MCFSLKILNKYKYFTGTIINPKYLKMYKCICNKGQFFMTMTVLCILSTYCITNTTVTNSSKKFISNFIISRCSIVGYNYNDIQCNGGKTCIYLNSKK